VGQNKTILHLLSSASPITQPGQSKPVPNPVQTRPSTDPVLNPVLTGTSTDSVPNSVPNPELTQPSTDNPLVVGVSDRESTTKVIE